MVYSERIDLVEYNNFIEAINLNDVINIETKYYDEDEYISHEGLNFYSICNFEYFREGDDYITYVVFDEDDETITELITISYENTNLIDFNGYDEITEFLEINNIYFFKL